MRRRSSLLCAVALAVSVAGGPGGSVARCAEPPDPTPVPATPPSPDFPPPLARPRVALALSGGGARGLAHIGVLLALERCSVPIDAIAGTSMGALVGGLYAIGYSPDELCRIAVDAAWYDVFLGGPRRSGRLDAEWPLLELDLDAKGLRIPTGLVPGDRLDEVLALLVLRGAGTTDFSAARIPFAAVATDLETGEAVRKRRGSLTRALRASSAIPGFISPIADEDRLLTDGGLAENLPVDSARILGADLVVAVDASSPLKKREEIRTFVDVIDQATSFRIVEGVMDSRRRADVLIVPALSAFKNFDFEPENVAALVQAGEAAGDAACERIRALGGITTEEPARGRRLPRGESVHIRDVSVEGAGPRTSRLARRLFGPVPEDGELPIRQLSRRLAQIRATGLFSRVTAELPAPGPEGARLVIQLTEAAPFRIRLGARYDEKYGGLGRAALTWRRTVGPIRDLTLGATFSGREEALLEARHDRLLETRFHVAVRGAWWSGFDRVWHEETELGELAIERLQAEATAGAVLSRTGQVAIGLRAERVHTDDSSSALARDTDDHERTTLSSVIARLELDTTDRTYGPSSGVRLRAESALSLERLGSNRDFARIDAAATVYRGLVGRLTLVGRARLAGRIAGDLPLSEELTAGGSELAPGYPIDAYRADRLAALALGIRIKAVRLPSAMGSAGYVGIEAAAAAIEAADSLPGPAGPLLGVALFAGIDTRLGPIEARLGFGRPGRQRLTLSAGPRF